MKLKRLLQDFANRLPLIGDLRRTRLELQELHSEFRSLQSAAAIAFKEFALVGHPRYDDPHRLLRSAAQVCSQNGEDGMIREIFRRIGTRDQVFVELGIGDGSENNTAFLLSQGWSGFWIDGREDFLRVIAARPDLGGGCLRAKSAFITKENVKSLFSELGVPQEFDFLSLDLDQNTFHVWEGLDGFRPRVAVVEYNPTLPADVEWKVNYAPGRVWDGSHNYGASLKSLEILGRRLGYSLVGCEFAGTNAFFVRDDLVGDHFAAPFTAANHYEPARMPFIHRGNHPPAILDRPLSTAPR